MHFVKYYLIIRMMTKIHCHAFLGVNLMVLRDWLKPKFDKCWLNLFNLLYKNPCIKRRENYKNV